MMMSISNSPSVSSTSVWRVRGSRVSNGRHLPSVSLVKYDESGIGPPKTLSTSPDTQCGHSSKVMSCRAANAVDGIVSRTKMTAKQRRLLNRACGRPASVRCEGMEEAEGVIDGQATVAVRVGLQLHRRWYLVLLRDL